MTAQWKDVVLDGIAEGPVTVRVCHRDVDKKTAPLVLYLHGGAFLDKAEELEMPVARCLADAGAIVVTPDERGPDRSAFPKALESAFAILAYLSRKRTLLGAKKSLLFVAGEEAGGNLAAGVALKARDQMPGMLDGQILISPLLDPFMGTKSFRRAEESGMRERWVDGWNRYLGFLGGVCHPYAAPRFCSRLGGVAPAMILTAQDDPLRDESTGYGDRLKEAGVSVNQQILPAGMGWSTIYGGHSGDKPLWQEKVGQIFEAFVEDMRARPE
ncbi:alpha/beta hydrolase fold domain-containing protein [Rhizobium sp. RAF56]|uniref:alpha/beta hydrolase fold domain-containing protein n=1 Tax=Rhizobium sp. RAF56 TaxID=3233062 RepID=UPI003F96554A